MARQHIIQVLIRLSYCLTRINRELWITTLAKQPKLSALLFALTVRK